jgi:hypothetical protein
MALRRALRFAAPFVLVALGFDLIHAFPYGLMYDDGYFYAQIAYNLGRFGQSSFDGFNTTSGYHLPWALVLALVSKAVGLLSWAKPVQLYAFQVVFAGLALHAARVHYARAWERACALALVAMGSLLMETLLLSVLLLVLARLETDPGRAERGFARLLLAFAIPLVRIDALLILGVYAALRAVAGSVRPALSLGGAALLGAVAQVGVTLALFGEPFAVSASLKAGAASPFSERAWQSLVGPEGGIAMGYAMRAALFLVLAGVTLGLCLAGHRNETNRRLLALGAGVTAFSAGHLVLHLIPFWCYLPAYLVLWFALLRCEVGRPALRRLRQATLAGVALVASAFAAHKVVLHVRNAEIARGARDFVDRIQDHVPEGGRIYQIDGSGFTGFFSQRSVVNGDGLVNSYEYARRMRAGRLGGILDEQGVCYVITNRESGAAPLVDFGGLVVARADVDEVFRTATYGRFPTTDFVLYRRRASGCSAG